MHLWNFIYSLILDKGCLVLDNLHPLQTKLLKEIWLIELNFSCCLLHKQNLWHTLFIFQFLLIFRKAAAGELAEDSGLYSLYTQLEEIDVEKEGVKGAKDFFQAKVGCENPDNTPHSSPVRVRYGVPFVSPNCWQTQIYILPHSLVGHKNWLGITHWGCDKMTAILQTTLSMHFVQWKSLNFY